MSSCPAADRLRPPGPGPAGRFRPPKCLPRQDSAAEAWGLREILLILHAKLFAEKTDTHMSYTELSEQEQMRRNSLAALRELDTEIGFDVHVYRREA